MGMDGITSSLINGSVGSLSTMRDEAMATAKTDEERNGIKAKFDMLEFQAKNDAINLIIGTLSNMLKSNKNVGDQLSGNIK